MTFACTDCSRCGKCYPKESVCAKCGADINLLDEECAQCGEAITEAMRDAARQAYKERKKQEKLQILELAKAARLKREAEAGSKEKFKYPWEQ